jgi:hypothetical protein
MAGRVRIRARSTLVAIGRRTVGEGSRESGERPNVTMLTSLESPLLSFGRFAERALRSRLSIGVSSKALQPSEVSAGSSQDRLWNAARSTSTRSVRPVPRKRHRPQGRQARRSPFVCAEVAPARPYDEAAAESMPPGLAERQTKKESIPDGIVLLFANELTGYAATRFRWRCIARDSDSRRQAVGSA